MSYAVQRTISFTDLEDAGYNIIVHVAEDETLYIEESQRHQIYKALKVLGIKINVHTSVEIQQVCHHRTMSGKETTNHRFLGLERTDREWLNSGYASDEVKVSRSKMGDMSRQLHKLANGGE